MRAFHPTSFLKMPEGMAGDIEAHYERYIRPHCVEFERKRQEALAESARRGRRALPLYVAIAVLVVGAIWLLYPNASDKGDAVTMPLTLGGLAAVGLAAWVQWPKGQYKRSIKQEIFPQLFRFFGEDFAYEPEGLSVSVSSLEPSGIIPSYNTNGDSNEDVVRGSYQGVELELFESTLIRGSGKHRKTVFRGMFISFAMNKAFHGRTVVKRDAGKLGNFFGDKMTSLENVALEDPRFEKQFEVYSSDQVEARYLLTPAFMERLLHLEALIRSGEKKKAKGAIQAAFYGNKLLLMVPSSHNRFEVQSISKPVTFYEEINAIMAEMHDIFGIIEQLKLHEQTRL